MFLLARPPVLRWVLAVGLVLVALWADLRPDATVEHPFARSDLPVGAEITRTEVDMVEIPTGILESVELPLVLGRPVVAGEPILRSSSSPDEVTMPDGWLQVELAVPVGAHPGSTVVVVATAPAEGDAPDSYEGLVVSSGGDGDFGARIATCAFPPEQATEVAVAASQNRISVLIGS
jgi:hypothetical protein